jgi:hypothetical protein
MILPDGGPTGSNPKTKAGFTVCQPVDRVPPPQELLVKWRSQAGWGFNLSTVCLLWRLPSNMLNMTVLSESAAPGNIAR